MPKVEFRNIQKPIDKKRGLHNLNLVVEEGEYVVLLGPTGHGKTSILNLIGGITTPDSGEILIDGILVNDFPPEDRNVGFVFEQFALFPHLELIDNVVYGPRVRGQDLNLARSTAKEMLNMLMLENRNDAYPSELSGGMKQRVGIARALTTGAHLVLMDEPYGALDAKVRRVLRREIRQLAKDLGLTVIHATHDVTEAMEVADKIVLIKDGHLIQCAPPEEIYTKPTNLFVAVFLGETNLFEGTVQNLRKNEIVIKVGNQEIEAQKSKKMKIGDHVACVVRAEHIRIVKPNYKGSNRLEGKIFRSRFVSGFQRYQIASEDFDHHITIMNLAKVLGDHEINEDTVIRFSPKDVLIYPIPEGGLEEVMKYV
ncbi:MAG: ABC transporter ATP-binding protein [Candidatus Ranarchaeia archaeon]|jgi:ABC-type Fe3+/spermidine/putrescine transport system ATPase subunit